MSNSLLRIFRRESQVHVLGPGARAVIWVQGCMRGCPGCIAPEGWNPAGGVLTGVDELATWVHEQEGIEGITLSGGEPFEQAIELGALIRQVQLRRDLGVVCYTGYTHQELQSPVGKGWHELLEVIDLLIDGPYSEAQHANLLWRASANQRLIPLTERYRAEVERMIADSDVGAGLELGIGSDGLNYTGIPPEPGFRAEFAARLRGMGIQLAEGEIHGNERN